MTMLTTTMLTKNRIAIAILAATTGLAAHAGDPVGAARGWLGAFDYNHGWRVDQHPRILADVNGDGMDDIIGFGGAAIFVSLSTGSQYLPPKTWNNDYVYRRGWRVDKHPRLLADVDGDGMDDIVGFGGAGVRVALSTGDLFQEDGQWCQEFTIKYGWVDAESQPRYLADVNGDGLADIVGFDEDKLVAAISDGVGSFEVDSRWGIPFEHYYYGTYDGFDPDRHQRFVTDVDGDGRADMVAIKDDTRIHLSSTSGLAQQPSLTIDDFGYYDGYNDNNSYPRYIADMDGNGVKDIVGFAHDRIYVTLLEKIDPDCADACAIQETQSVYTDGTRAFVLAYSDWRNSVHPRFVEDVNGDGRADVVGFAAGEVWVSYSDDTDGDGLGDTLTALVRTVSGYGLNSGWKMNLHVRTLADVDGNGRADIVGFGGANVYVSRFNTFAPEDCIRQVHPEFDPSGDGDQADYDRVALRSLCVFD